MEIKNSTYQMGLYIKNLFDTVSFKKLLKQKI